MLKNDCHIFSIDQGVNRKKRTENFSNNALRHDAGNDPKLNKELMHKELIFFKI